MNQQPIQQQPGGFVVAPVPVNIPADCPPGLEHLVFTDQVIVKQKVELLEVFCNWETENKYHVLNPLGQQIYYAKEDTNCCNRQCCGNLRPFTMHITDNTGREVLRLERPYRFVHPCQPCILPLNFCFLQKMEVYSPSNGVLLGTVNQLYHLFLPRFSIIDSSGMLVCEITGPFCTNWCGNINFELHSNGTSIGKITKAWSGLAKEVFTDADNFGVQFPLQMPVSHKALIFATVFLIDFIYYEQKANNDN